MALVSLSDYRAMVADHPRKFSESEVGYTPAARNSTTYYCDECLHFYEGPAAHRNVCEILRRVGEASIEAKAKCSFWTRTGQKHPLLERVA